MRKAIQATVIPTKNSHVRAILTLETGRLVVCIGLGDWFQQ